MSACLAMAGSAAKSSAERAGRSSGVPGKLTPFSRRSLSPLARAPTTSTIRSFPSRPTTRPRILPSSIQTRACKGRRATTSGKPIGDDRHGGGVRFAGETAEAKTVPHVEPARASSAKAFRRDISVRADPSGFCSRGRISSAARLTCLAMAAHSPLVVVRAVDPSAIQSGGDETSRPTRRRSPLRWAK